MEGHRGDMQHPEHVSARLGEQTQRALVRQAGRIPAEVLDGACIVVRRAHRVVHRENLRAPLVEKPEVFGSRGVDIVQNCEITGFRITSAISTGEFW